MESTTPILAEPLEMLAPRLIGCMEKVVSSLRSHGISVETNEAFLLDLSAVRYSVPQTVDGFPIQMGFVGSIPPWADQVRYHLHVCLVGERRWSIYEAPKGFNISRIVTRILQQLDKLKQAQAEREQVAARRALAEQRLADLGAVGGIVQVGPLQLAQDNLKVQGLAESPDEVLVTIKTSHENAAKIAQEFRVVARQRQRKA